MSMAAPSAVYSASALTNVRSEEPTLTVAPRGDGWKIPPRKTGKIIGNDGNIIGKSPRKSW
jgi:hypothetical protein